MFLYRLVLILVLFFPFNLYEGVLLQLGYWQTKKIVLLQELHALLLIRQFFFFFFFWTMTKMKSLKEFFPFYWKNEGEMGNPERKQNSVFVLQWRNNKIFQSITAVCVRQFKERIQFSIGFMRVL